MAINMTIPGYMEYNSLLVLENLSKMVPSEGIAIEIGSLYGRSSWCIANTIPKSSKLFCIDAWDDLLYPINDNRKKFYTRDMSIFLKNVQDCENIFPIKAKSPDMIIWDKLVDFVFIDDSHYFLDTLKNMNFWYKRLKIGGILCGDDYDIEFRDVVKVVDFFRKQNNLTVNINDRIWWLKKE